MRRHATALILIMLPLLAGLGCRPDPYALALRMIEPGQPVELGDGRTLTVERTEGEVLYGVRIEGPAETCKGTMVAEAPEARLERPAGADGRPGPPRIVFERPVIVERCGDIESVTRNDRLTVSLDALL